MKTGLRIGVKAIGILALFGFSPGSVLAKTHPFSWEDLFGMIRLADPQPSPDGRQVLFSQTAYDVQANKGNSDLALIQLPGGEHRILTRDSAGDSNGRWLPDGKSILFLSSRSGSRQLWRMPVDGGEARQVSRLPVDLQGFELSPDGSRVLFWAEVFPECKDLKCTADRMKDRQENPVKARVYDSLFVRHWDRFEDGRRNHLFVMDLTDLAPFDLTPGWDQDSPTRPWGGADEFDWSPDGKWVALSSKPAKGEAWHTNTEIYLAQVPDRLRGRSNPRLITKDNPAWDTHPVFSPDGGHLAYLAMDRPGYESDRFHIVLFDLQKNKGRSLTGDWDRSVQEMIWSADGKYLYVTAAENARTKIFEVNAESGAVRPLVQEGSCRDLRRTRLGNLIFLRDRMTHPREVFTCNPATGQVQQISQVNASRLAAVRMSEPEEFWFENGGFRIHGWLLKPVDFQKGRTYPLAFLIHGGPQGHWGDDFHYRWNPQFYAGAGYVAVAIDFRGSTSYGQKFTDAIRTDWGPGPYSDLMAGLGHVLREYRFVDQRRMCALGASFGGYMINWIAGQDHPFACLVNHDGDFDIVSHFYSTEELWFPEWEMTGTPWQKMEIYQRNSPAQFVQRWKTPMLVIQGALDFRVTECESLATFNVLQRLGIESKLLYFPDENHWVLKPQNSRLWHQTVREWLDRFTRKGRKR